MKRKILTGLLLLLVMQISLFAQSKFKVTYAHTSYKSFIKIGTFSNLINYKDNGALAISYDNISGESIHVQIIVYDNAGRQIRDFETWTPVKPYSTDFITIFNATKSEVGRVHVKKVAIVE